MSIPIEILLVEDNMVDIRLTQEALRESKVLNNLHVARDGEDALDYLFRRSQYTNAVQPQLILLDLNLPRVDGRQVLEEIKRDERLKHIPVVMLTTSTVHEDITRSYQLNVNCYISKPVDLNQFIEVLKAIDYFWFSIVSLPRSPN